jgi:hypothetical protein
MLYEEEKQTISRLRRWVVVRMMMAVRPYIGEMMDTVRTRGGKQSQKPQNRAERDKVSAVSSGLAEA